METASATEAGRPGSLAGRWEWSGWSYTRATLTSKRLLEWIKIRMARSRGGSGSQSSSTSSRSDLSTWTASWGPCWMPRCLSATTRTRTGFSKRARLTRLWESTCVGRRWTRFTLETTRMRCPRTMATRVTRISFSSNSTPTLTAASPSRSGPTALLRRLWALPKVPSCFSDEKSSGSGLFSSTPIVPETLASASDNGSNLSEDTSPALDHLR
mmetsp:Transcript_12464/g.24723  ORF Transcript_12464/g.24723 Transcript_12464/m.24723 type:complete len:213 (-) Transcript_12464:51-689(-)